MRKTASIIMLLALMLTLLSGCFRLPKNVIEQLKPSASNEVSTTQVPQDDSQDNDNGSGDSDTPATLTAATNPSEGYQNYLTVKGDAIDRIMKATETSDAMSLTVTMSIMGYSMMDLTLIWMTLFTDDLLGTEAAMAFMGMKDVKVTSDSSGYTITFKDDNGGIVKQTCQYDAAKDQLTSTMYDADNKVSMFFEYVNLGDNTYASQYYYPSDDNYQVVRAYFDTSDVAAFGTLNSNEKPASILGKSGLDESFVKNDETYFILKGGKPTVFGQD